MLKIPLPKSGKFFSIIADATMDLSKTVCVCLRYVQHDFRIEEIFFGFLTINVATADGIFELLNRV